MMMKRVPEEDEMVIETDFNGYVRAVREGYEETH